MASIQSSPSGHLSTREHHPDEDDIPHAVCAGVGDIVHMLEGEEGEEVEVVEAVPCRRCAETEVSS